MHRIPGVCVPRQCYVERMPRYGGITIKVRAVQTSRVIAFETCHIQGLYCKYERSSAEAFGNEVEAPHEISLAFHLPGIYSSNVFQWACWEVSPLKKADATVRSLQVSEFGTGDFRRALMRPFLFLLRYTQLGRVLPQGAHGAHVFFLQLQDGSRLLPLVSGSHVESCLWLRYKSHRRPFHSF